MAAPADISKADVDNAFYKSYGEGSGKGLDPTLAGPGGKGRRPLTLDPRDTAYRECWMEVRRLLREDKGLCPVPKGSPIGSAVMACPAKPVKSDSPKYEPLLWNDGGVIQKSTNCYAYAMNSRAGHPAGGKPQPGDTSGTPTASPVTCPSTTNAVLKDGKPDHILPAPRCPYNQQQKRPPPDKAGCYLVALVITSKPDGYDAVDGVVYVNDYHWYRQDDDGSWSHKPGHAIARNTDASGNPIANPETANRRSAGGVQFIPALKKSVPVIIDYDMLCGYFYVKKGGATV
jgi:hypothetical protein